ncbi:MAG: DUF401 family protein [Bacillota bacterium]|nr:DUF401 family protein [Bacillota bacterium]
MELLKLILIFVLIIAFLGFKKPMYVVMLGASVLLALLFAMPAKQFLLVFGGSLISSSTLVLVAIVWLVMIMEGMMNERGFMQKILTALDALFHSRRIDLAMMPMIIGFLPSAGGALFSAPLVAKAAEGLGLAPEKKALVNIYFRHIMELFFPTYPALIIAAQLSGLPMFNLVKLLFPVTVVAFCIGLLMLREVKSVKTERAGEGSRWKLLGAFLLSIWPFLLLITLIMAARLEAVTAVLITTVCVAVFLKVTPRELPRMVLKVTKWKLLLIIITVMAFKDVLLSSGAVDQLPEIVGRLPISPLFAFSILALFISLITGLPISANAIIIPLASAAIPGIADTAIALLVISSYVGAQLTPLHLCITISAEYFEANLQKVILRSLPPYLSIYAAAALLFGVILA